MQPGRLTRESIGAAVTMHATERGGISDSIFDKLPDILNSVKKKEG
jgi:hypothetical protein